jgi:mannose-6-phosphate isomerase-like protein (cupin superfamily)
MSDSPFVESVDLGDYVPLQPFVSQRTPDRSIWYEGQLIVIYADTDATGHTCCVFEGNCPEGMGPPPHIHLYDHEIFFIMEGKLKAWVDSVEYEVPKDSMIFLPCGLAHWFISDAPVTRIFTFTVNAGRGRALNSADMQVFKEFGRPAEAMSLPPPPDPAHLPDKRAVMRMASENGLVFPRLEMEGWLRAFGRGGGPGGPPSGGAGGPPAGQA